MENTEPVDTTRPFSLSKCTPAAIEYEVSRLRTLRDTAGTSAAAHYAVGALQTIEWLFTPGSDPPAGMDFAPSEPEFGPEPHEEKSPLVASPLARALITKWNRGRATHGEEFQGEPLEELFEELVDAVHYAEEGAISGVPDCRDLARRLLELAQEVQALWELTQKGQLEAAL